LLPQPKSFNFCSPYQKIVPTPIRLHVANYFLGLPERHKNMPYLSTYHWPVPSSAKFRENRNSMETGKFHGWAQSSVLNGKL